MKVCMHVKELVDKDVTNRGLVWWYWGYWVCPPAPPLFSVYIKVSPNLLFLILSTCSLLKKGHMILY